ncbi:hypothetical protein [Flavobacterium sp. HJJ]|uniref:hypothetical protein n=1 Tax=Flavobacterium sp. HJJ TaxID=2783792 RepID=UPI00188C922A|nr:hypothetical protein [Flavobacterium sp. HJJ]MBF4471086.1 hypothetical protein [Flavobacterium sp. HJJ]
MMYAHHSYNATKELIKTSQTEYNNAKINNTSKEMEAKMEEKQLKITENKETLRTKNQLVSSENHHYIIALSKGYFFYPKEN